MQRWLGTGAVGAVVALYRCCEYSGGLVHVLWVQLWFSTGAVGAVVAQYRCCGCSGASVQVLWVQWWLSTGGVGAVVAQYRCSGCSGGSVQVVMQSKKNTFYFNKKTFFLNHRPKNSVFLWFLLLFTI